MRVDSSILSFKATHAAAESVEAEERLITRKPGPTQSSWAETGALMDTASCDDARTAILLWFFEHITGRKAHLHRVPRLAAAESAAPHSPAAWGVSYSRREIHREAERTSFSAAGKVRLATGAEISFALNLELNRDQTEIDSVAFRAGNMSDPIAVNFDGQGVRLGNGRMAFDLDADGIDEWIATLATGSAWLARDLNGNGSIDAGSELFGPATGDGFGELAAMDDDGNGWIDEADSAYCEMGLWSGGEFTGLRDAGVGALAVSAIPTPFALKLGGDRLGQVRQSGVYLRDDGSPGVLEQVDLSI